jgi:hypothetical protein
MHRYKARDSTSRIASCIPAVMQGGPHAALHHHDINSWHYMHHFKAPDTTPRAYLL